MGGTDFASDYDRFLPFCHMGIGFYQPLDSNWKGLYN